MSLRRSPKLVSHLKQSRKYRRLLHQARQTRRKLHLEFLEDRRVMAAGPSLAALLPNSSVLLDLTTGVTNTRHVAPRELTFRFAATADLDPVSLANGIKVTRAGFDNAFGAMSPNPDVLITPGFIGLGETPREVIMRFTETLPDDLYNIEIIGTGATPLRDVNGVPFGATATAMTVGKNQAVLLDLDLGAQVVAVVPQPTTSLPGGQVTQRQDQILVYFNEDDLSLASAQNVNFYKLYATRNSLDNAQQVEYTPTSAVYDAAKNLVTLTFAQPLHQLGITDDGTADPYKAFRLRVGTDESQLGRTSTAIALNPATHEPGSAFVSAYNFDAQGQSFNVGLGQSLAVQAAIEPQPYTLVWPGGNDDPGHREIPIETHLLGAADTTGGSAVVTYDFRQQIGVIPDGIGGLQPAFNAITNNQKQRAREVLELYGRYAGVKFVETEFGAITIATGDLRILGTPSAPGGVIGLAGAGPLTFFQPTAVMDNAEIWDDLYGENWFETAMHEIGHLLGQGHTYDLPPLTVQGEDPALLFNSPNAEPVFPGDNDNIHMRHMYRPDSKDIDLYRFQIDSPGLLSIETLAERLPTSSLLDTYVRLYRVDVNGVPQLLAANDDYFSKDSYMELTAEPGIYFVGVSAKGNDAYDPTIFDTGIGGTSDGAYELRIDFRKNASSSIVDLTGTRFDGDADGLPGGVFNFWFRAAAPKGQEQTGRARTVFVNKAAPAGGTGTLTAPYNNIQTALANARAFDIVRIVGNAGSDGQASTLGDNLAYKIGFNAVTGAPLDDGSALIVPKDVTVMIDEGAIFQLRQSRINVGSTSPAIASDRSGGALQVLGTPNQQVFFTSYNEQGANTVGKDENPLITSPAPGDWGGIIFRNDVDRADGRFDFEDRGVFLNYVNYADFRYGGGRVIVDSVSQIITPVQMIDSRPTVTFNTITLSADAAISANPDSFEETNFHAPRYFFDATPDVNGQIRRNALDYKRVGPDIHGNKLVRVVNGQTVSNTTNGLFVRSTTPAGNTLEELTVAGRFNDTDIVHVIAENLIISGTPGGPTLEASGPALDLVVLGTTSGGRFAAGTSWEYKITYVDLLGNEGQASTTTSAITVNSAGRSIVLNNLPVPGGEFVGRRIYRRPAGSSVPFLRVGQVPASITTFTDRGPPTSPAGSILSPDAGLNQELQVPSGVRATRPRLDGSLTVDPSIILKLDGSRIDIEMGASLIMEGLDGLEVIATSLSDDRYGAGGTFDTRNDNGTPTARNPAPGDWGGIFAAPDSTFSMDQAVVTFGGGLNRVEGSFTGINAVELHQANARISNTLFADNADGTGGQAPTERFGRGFNAPGTIFVRAAQPTIVKNIFRDNEAALININAGALNADTVTDPGRALPAVDFALLADGLPRVVVDRVQGHLDNNGPFIDENRLENNGINGMVVRGATLTTESVWDDTDIVHVVFDAINIADFHTFGGLRLESAATESLVAKFEGDEAGIWAQGRPLEIDDRIGGRLHVLGQPGFPVVLTSLSDDTVGAGVTPGVPQIPVTDTDNNGASGGGGGGGTLPTGPEVNNGLLIDNDVPVNVVGHFEVMPGPGGGVAVGPNDGVTAQGNATLFTNADFIFEFLNYVSINNGPGIQLGTTTITQAPMLVSPDVVESRGNFPGPNGQVDWIARTYLNNGVAIVFNEITLTSAAAGQPLGNVRLINYLDEDVVGFTDDLLYLTGTPGQPNFRAFTLDNPERVGFSQGGIYVAGPGLSNATYDGFAADEFADLRTAITAGTATYSPTGVIDTTSLTPFVDPALGNVWGLEDITTAFAWSVDATQTTATITSFLELVPQNPVGVGNPGEWVGLTLERFSHDRNVETVLELEPADGIAPGVNSIPENAQFLGALAPNEKGGDENRRLGYTIHGLINAPNDVDVYSFRADAQTEVWIDIDRSTHALDTVVELVDDQGNTIVRSLNSGGEEAGTLELYDPLDIANRMQKAVPYEGRDFYTTNPRDPGFRVVLPGPRATTNTYHIRVRSNSGAIDDLTAGATKGVYQLELRLHEKDEFGGSTIRYADIRNATNGIAVLGMPIHTPLGGENGEDQANNNDTIGGAQNIGNLLNSDRGAVSVAGLLSAGDVDWYQFDVTWDAVQGTASGPWPTIFDLDYADGLGRANTVLNVFDANGQLILSSRDSNVAEDRPGPLDGTDVDDLNRGTIGTADPWIGTQYLAPGTYYVAVSTDAVMPTDLSQFFNRLSTSPFTRLEPIASVQRIVEDHLYEPGYVPMADPNYGTAQPPLGPGNGDFLSFESEIPWHLGDVTLYVATENAPGPESFQLFTVDPFTGQVEINPNAALALPPQAYDIGDIVMRPRAGGGYDLVALSLDEDDITTPTDPNRRDDEAGNYLRIDPHTSAVQNLGDDGIRTYERDVTWPLAPQGILGHLHNGTRYGWGVNFNALAWGDVANNPAGERLLAIGNRGDEIFLGLPPGNGAGQDPNWYIPSRQNILYQMNPAGAGHASLTVPIDRRIDPILPAEANLVNYNEGAYTDALEVGEIFTLPVLFGIDATLPAPNLFNVNDGLAFAVNDGTGLTIYEFDAGPEVLQNINPNLGQIVRDGEFFTLDPDLATADDEDLYQFDTGPVVNFNIGCNAVTAGFLDGQSVTVNSPAGSLTFELDLNGMLAGPTNVPVVLGMTNMMTGVVTCSASGAGAIAAAVEQAINASFLLPMPPAPGFTASAQAVGTRLSLVNEIGVTVSPGLLTDLGGGLTAVSIQGSNGIARVLELDPTLTVADIEDTDVFVLQIQRNGVPFQYRFEFDTNNAWNAANTRMDISGAVTHADVAAVMEAAINSVGPDLIAQRTQGAMTRVIVNGAFINLPGGFQQNTATEIRDLTQVLTTFLVPVEEFFSAAQIGASVATVVNGAASQFSASAALERINFPPFDTAAKNPAQDVDVDGVTWWVKQLSAFGVAPGNNSIPFEADDTSIDIANRVAQAINALQAPEVTALVTGDIVRLNSETGFARFDTSLSAGKLTTFGQGPGGVIRGMANLNTQIYAVSDQGGLYRLTMDLVANSAGASPSVTTTYITTSARDLQGINFQGLTAMPPNVEGGRYNNMLFGIDDNGRMYAFNTRGELQPIFSGGRTFVDTGITQARGLAFSPLDENLWHMTTERGADQGHGHALAGGVLSYKFGIENDPIGPGVDPRIAYVGNTYDFPGGAHGSLISNEFSLEGYNPADQPVLYFTYYLDNENAGSNDAFRVFITGNEGDWQLVGGTDGGTPIYADTGTWRQVRINLAGFAGRTNLRMRLDFSTAGSMAVGDPRTTGDELRAVAATFINEGSTFTIDGNLTFEFDQGFLLTTPTGAGVREGETFTIDDGSQSVTFEFDRDGTLAQPASPTYRALPILATDTAAQVAVKMILAINAAGLTGVITRYTNDNVVNVTGSANLWQGGPGAPTVQLAGNNRFYLLAPAATAVIEGETFTITDAQNRTVTFEMTTDAVVSGMNRPVLINATMDGAAVAQAIIAAINGLPVGTLGVNASTFANPRQNEVLLAGARTLRTSAGAGVLQRITGVAPNNIAVPIHREMTRVQVANSINLVLENQFFSQQLIAVAGAGIADASTFVLDVATDSPLTFEFDSGYVMSVPLGGGNPLAAQHVNDGDTFTLRADVPGLGIVEQIFEFDKDVIPNFTPGNWPVPITDASTQLNVARAIEAAVATAPNTAALGLDGKVISGTRVLLRGRPDADWTSPGLGFFSNPVGLFTVTGLPGITDPTRVRVQYDPDVNFTPHEMALALKTAIDSSRYASYFVTTVGAMNAVDQARVRLTGLKVTLVPNASGLTLDLNTGGIAANDNVKQYRDLIRIIDHRVTNQGPLGLEVPAAPGGEILQGDGVLNRVVAPVNRFYLPPRLQNNAEEGAYVDDFVIGFAERGEAARDTTANNAYVANPLFDASSLTTGTYQLEIRRGPNYDLPGPMDPLAITHNTNARFTEQLTIETPAGHALADGQTFTLTDGTVYLTFEFNDVTIAGGGVTPGNVRIDFNPSDPDYVIARRIVAAINSNLVQQQGLELTAQLSEGTLLGPLSTDNRVNVIGPASLTVRANGAPEINDTLATAVDTGYFGAPYFVEATIGDRIDFFNAGTGGLDVDLFRVDLAMGQLIRVDIDAASRGSFLNSVLRIFDAAGNQLAISLNNAAPGEAPTFDSYLQFTAPADGLYYIGVSGEANAAYNPVDGSGAVVGSTGRYQLEITPVLPSAIPVTNYFEPWGDDNHHRDQGQIILQSNTISNSAEWGILVDNGARQGVDGQAPHQGPVRNLDQLNVNRLVPGVVIANNVLYNNTDGGIRFSGDTLGAAVGAVPFGRIVNNTIYGPIGANQVTQALVNDADDLFVVDTSTFNVTQLGTLATPLTDIAASLSGQVFGSTAATPSQLVRVNVTIPGGALPITTVGAIRTTMNEDVTVAALEVRADNVLYGAGVIAGENWLFTIDQATGVATRVISLGTLVAAGDLSFDALNNIFISCTDGTLFRVDAAGTAGASVGNLGQADVFGLTFEPYSTYLGFRAGGEVLSVDPATAVTTAVGTLFHPRFANLLGATSLSVSITGGGTGTGIQVDESASPTLLNNILANLTIGIDVDASSRAAGTVVGGSVYQGNATNSNVTGDGDFPIRLSPTAPLFVNPDAGNFYLRAFSQAIDSSVDSLLDRTPLITVRDPLGIALSPILAPDRDVTGQLRIDDPSVETPEGFGENVFKDRGALDRVDFTGPTSVLLNPRDNDAEGVDAEPAPTIVSLANQPVTDFQIQLVDAFSPLSPLEGTGIDDLTVTGARVRVTEMLLGAMTTRTLVEGVDYAFTYDATNNIIRLTPLAGLWPTSRTYTVYLDNLDTTIPPPPHEGDPEGATPEAIRDLAGNLLTPNQLNGVHKYTIFLGSSVDYGDAPASYGTLLANDGARHTTISGFQLGASVTPDADGQPAVGANVNMGDDGVTFASLVPGGNAQIQVTSSAGRLDAWIDFDNDGVFEPSEHLNGGTSFTLIAGVNNFAVAIPAATPRSIPIYARFRLSSAGGLGPTGEAPDGEVEDYALTFTGPPFQNPRTTDGDGNPFGTWIPPGGAVPIPLGTLDVNDDGFITAFDALLVINQLNRLGPIYAPGNIPLPNPQIGPAPDPSNGIYYYDVDGDTFLSPSDAARIINRLNFVANNPSSLVAGGAGEGEGEEIGGLPLAAIAPAFQNDAPAGTQALAPAVLYAATNIVVETRSPAAGTMADEVFGEGEAESWSAEPAALGLAEPLAAATWTDELALAGPLTADGKWDFDDLLAELADDVESQGNPSQQA